MADETTQDQPAKSAPEATKPTASQTGNVVLEEAKAREADIIKKAEEKGLPAVINGPGEDPYKGVDPAFIY